MIAGGQLIVKKTGLPVISRSLLLILDLHYGSLAHNEQADFSIENGVFWNTDGDFIP